MRAQSPRRKVERGPRPCAGLEEQVGDRDTGEFASLIGRLAREAAVDFGAIEYRDQRVLPQALKRDEVAQPAGAVQL